MPVGSGRGANRFGNPAAAMFVFTRSRVALSTKASVPSARQSISSWSRLVFRRSAMKLTAIGASRGA